MFYQKCLLCACSPKCKWFQCSLGLSRLIKFIQLHIIKTERSVDGAVVLQLEALIQMQRTQISGSAQRESLTTP